MRRSGSSEIDHFGRSFDSRYLKYTMNAVFPITIYLRSQRILKIYSLVAPTEDNTSSEDQRLSQADSALSDINNGRTLTALI